MDSGVCVKRIVPFLSSLLTAVNHMDLRATKTSHGNNVFTRSFIAKKRKCITGVGQTFILEPAVTIKGLCSS